MIRPSYRARLAEGFLISQTTFMPKGAPFNWFLAIKIWPKGKGYPGSGITTPPSCVSRRIPTHWFSSASGPRGARSATVISRSLGSIAFTTSFLLEGRILICRFILLPILSHFPRDLSLNKKTAVRIFPVGSSLLFVSSLDQKPLASTRNNVTVRTAKRTAVNSVIFLSFSSIVLPFDFS